MTPNQNTTRAKRKADSPEQEQRPNRKKQKQQQQQQPASTSPSAASKSASTGLSTQLWKLYHAVANAIDQTGRLVASDFMKLPPKKRYPDYYVTIKKPIALDTIQGKIEKDEYADIEALKADFTLMTGNAKKYNVKGSSIYEDAVTIQQMVKDFSSEAPQAIKVTLRQPNTAKSRPLAPLPPKQTLQSAQEDVLGTVENVTEPRTKRLYSDIFMDAPSKKEYPEYYAIIKRVICLNEIQRNVRKGLYRTWVEFEADVNLVWENAMIFNEDGSQVYEDAKILKAAFEKALKEKKAEMGEPTESHLKLRLNLQQPNPSTKIKLHVPQGVSTPSIPSPPAPVKNESPVLPPQTLPPKPQRAGSPLKNQIAASPSKSPPSLRPAPPKVSAPTQLKDIGIPLTDWARTPQVPINNAATPARSAIPPHLRPPPPMQTPPSRTGVIPAPVENNVRQPNLLVGMKRERTQTLLPLVTISTPTQLASPVASDTLTSSSPQPLSTGLLLSITSTPPPTPSTQTFCLRVAKDVSELVLNAFLTKELTLHGSYTFTVTCNGRKLSPTIWPDASRRSGTTDSIAVATRGGSSPAPTSGVGDSWRFNIVLGEPGSVSSIEAGCTAFLKRDERGLLIRSERSRTGLAAGEDGGELERVVVLVLRGR